MHDNAKTSSDSDSASISKDVFIAVVVVVMLVVIAVAALALRCALQHPVQRQTRYEPHAPTGVAGASAHSSEA